MQALVGAVAQLATATAQRQTPIGGDADGTALSGLLVGASSDSFDRQRISGARGAAQEEVLRNALLQQPSRISETIRSRCKSHRAMGVANQELLTMYGYFANHVPMSNAKTAVYLVFVMCTVWDHMERGEWEQAEAILGLGLCAAEMAALRSWRPQPPWAQVNRAAPTDALMATPQLPSPVWVAAAAAYVGDVTRLDDTLKKIPAKGQPKRTAGAKDAERHE